MTHKIDCDMCEGRFDPRGEPYDVIATRMPLSPWLWICGNCGSGNSPEEIADHFDLSHRHVYQELGFEYPLTEDHAQTEEQLHQAARDFMDKYKQPSWKPLSLDEWLMEHGHHLTDAIKAEGQKIMDAFDNL